MAQQTARLVLDLERLAPWLAANVGPPGALRVTQFAGGQSNPTYRLDTDAGALVLRRKPPGPLLPKAHLIEREYRVMAALGGAGFPVPAMRAFCEDEGIIGSAFYVMDLVEGRVLFDTAMPGMAPGARRATWEAVVDTLAALHALDPAALGLGDFGRSGGYLTRQVAVWSRQYRASATDEIPEMERLIDWLPGAIEAIPDETCLVHGDWRLDNLVLHPERPEIAAVLDWELSTLGHPLADLGYLLMTWTFPQGLRHGLRGLDLDDLGIPPLEAMAARYAAATGRSEIPHLDCLLAFNAFRMAAILQGVHARALAGNAADATALEQGRAVAPLARIAWDHARAAGA